MYNLLLEFMNKTVVKHQNILQLITIVYYFPIDTYNTILI